MQEAIYKGATRPAMKWGVPLMALVGIFMPTIVAGMWGMKFIGLWFLAVPIVILVPLYFWMRWVTFKDDQRLVQMLTSLRLRFISRNHTLWGARSYSPYRSRGAKHV